MDDKDFAILERTNAVRRELVKLIETKLIDLEMEILNEMGVSLDEAREEWKKRKDIHPIRIPKPKGE